MHTQHALLSAILSIAREWSGHPEQPLSEVLLLVIRRKQQTCKRALQQTVRRLYNAANAVWLDHLQEITEPLAPPRLPWSLRSPDAPLEQRVFTSDEVRDLLRVSPTVSPYASALLTLLFTTGLRIGAMNDLRWNQVLTADRAHTQCAAVVREKGNRRRVFPLTRAAQQALMDLWLRRTAKVGDRVFPLCVRQLRNIFYKACHRAGMRIRMDGSVGVHPRSVIIAIHTSRGTP